MAEEVDITREEVEELSDRETETETPEENPIEEEETLGEPETSQEEKPETKSKQQSPSYIAQKEKWRNRAKTAEEKLEKVSSKTPSEWKEKVEFLLQNQDTKYSEEEFDHIANVSSRMGVTLNDAAKREDEYIQFKREKVAKEKGTPSSSSPSLTVSDKSSKDIENMSNEEYREFVKGDKDKSIGGRGGV